MSTIQEIERNSSCHPPKPLFKGSFENHAGPERIYFIKTGRRFLLNEKAVRKEDKFIIIPLGIAVSVQWIWSNKDWKIEIRLLTDQPTRRRKHWIKWE